MSSRLRVVSTACSLLLHSVKSIELRNPEDAPGSIGQSSHRCCRTAEMSAIVRRASGTCRNDMDFHVPGAALCGAKDVVPDPNANAALRKKSMT